MTPHSLPLKGVRLGISASETVTEHGQGLTPRELNRAIRQISQAVLAQGGRLVFGHDWRSHGVMEEILDFAIAYMPFAKGTDDETPLITNYLAWPDRTRVSAQDRKRYEKVLRIVEPDEAPPPPSGGRPYGDAPRSGQPRKAARAAALTRMRREMTEACTARICFGGKVSGSSGRYAGVAEEAAIALDIGCPLYVTSLFGGASAEIVRAIRTSETGEVSAFRPTKEVQQALAEYDPLPREAVDPSIFAEIGIDGLAGRSELNKAENERLFDARQPAEVIGLLLAGLARLKKARI